jgi:hypothetical protein
VCPPLDEFLADSGGGHTRLQRSQHDLEHEPDGVGLVGARGARSIFEHALGIGPAALQAAATSRTRISPG